MANSLLDEISKFVREKLRDLQAADYPTNICIEETFFDYYRNSGGACLCIDWLRKAYNLPQERPESPTDQTEKERIPAQWKEYYEKVLPNTIQERFKKFEDLSSQRFFKNNRIMQEIDANLKSYPTLNERKHYITHILKSFKEVADVLNPIASINEMEQTLKTLQQPMDDETTATCLIPAGPLPMSPMSRTEMVEKLQKDIEFIKKQMDRFNELAAHQEPDHISNYFSHWIGRMEAFAQQLANVAARYGIDLMDIQRDCKVYLIRKVIDCECYIPPQEGHAGPIYITNNNNNVSYNNHTEVIQLVENREETNHYKVSYNSTFITNQVPAKDSEEKGQETESDKENAKKDTYRTDCCFLYDNKVYFNEAITELTNKLHLHGLVPEEDTYDDFKRLFGGRSCHKTFTWLGEKHILTHFIKQLCPEKKGARKVITTWPEGYSKWKVVSQRFVDKAGNPLPDIHNETKRKNKELIYQDLVSVLTSHLPKTGKPI